MKSGVTDEQMCANEDRVSVGMSVKAPSRRSSVSNIYNGKRDLTDSRDESRKSLYNQ